MNLCIWPHEVNQLIGVDCPVEDLPRHCTCGDPITYSTDLVFISRPEVVADGLEVVELKA